MLTHAVFQVSSYSDIKFVFLFDYVDEPVVHRSSIAGFMES
jgi:hypothetical protein